MIFPLLSSFPRFALDTETTGLNYPVDKLFGFSISTPDGKDYYFDVRTCPESLNALKVELSKLNSTSTIVLHNASFDYRMFLTVGIHLPLGLLDDTCIRACLINEHLFSFSLDALASKYLGAKKDTAIYQELADLFGGKPTRKVQVVNFPICPEPIMAKYAKLDTRLTLELWDWQQLEKDKQDLSKIFDFERELLPVFIEREAQGVRVDIDYAHRAVELLTPLIAESRKKVDTMVGKPFNVNSPKQAKEAFEPVFKEGNYWIGTTLIDVTPKGNPSIDSTALRNIDSPLSNEILNLRSLLKTRDTFLTNHIIGSAYSGRVYPNINQNKGEQGGTTTGRLSYSSPALQQIPSRNKEVAKIVKTAFLPEEGCTWVDSDLSGFEVRVFAHLVNNSKLVAAYKKNPKLDLHQYVADLTGLPRNASYAGQPYAKALNLAAIFNSGNGAIAETMGLPFTWETFENKEGKTITYRKAGEKALALIAQYHRKLGGIKELANGCQRVAEQRGYVFTRKGRHLRFPRAFKTYQASAKLTQSTSADINKLNWLRIHGILKGTGGSLILNTHDSYSLSLPHNSRKELYTQIKNEIEQPILRVPLILDCNGEGRNWYEATAK